MKKFALMIFFGVLIMCGFLTLAVVGQVPIAVPPIQPIQPKSDLALPIITTLAVVSETLPIMNRKVHGIIHLLVTLFKLLSKNKVSS